MFEFKKYRLLLLGILAICAGAFLLAEASSKQARCESLGGQLVQLLDMDTKEGCAQVKVMFIFAYSAIAIGIALIVSNFVKKQGKR